MHHKDLHLPSTLASQGAVDNAIVCFLKLSRLSGITEKPPIADVRFGPTLTDSLKWRPAFASRDLSEHALAA